MITLSTLLSSFAAIASAKIYYAGVAESGGEFGAQGAKGTGLPGRFGTDYAFLNQSTLPIWIDQNKACIINTFRIPFLLERMCPPSSGLGNTFNDTYFNELHDAINAITSRGAYAIVGPHNYMRYNDPSSQPNSGSIIGNTPTDPSAATTAQFQSFWHELASRFLTNQHVIFQIMNEPHDMPTSLVLTNNQAAVTGIRACGAKQLILAPGNAYSGGHAWNQSAQGDEPNAEHMHKLVDPEKNMAIDIHEYFDADFSGQGQECVHGFEGVMDGVTAWLKTYGLKGFVTEFGASAKGKCGDYLKEALGYMEKHEEYIGWTAWAAGPLWGTNAPCCKDGQALGSLEPGSKAGDGGPGLYDTVWMKTIQPLVPNTLQKDGISRVHQTI